MNLKLLRKRKALLIANLRQGAENRRYKKDASGVERRRGVPIDHRPEQLKLTRLNQYIGYAQGQH